LFPQSGSSSYDAADSGSVVVDRSRRNSNSQSQQTERRNSTLVVIVGSLRDGERAWQSLYRNVLDHDMDDLALVIGKTGQDAKSGSSGTTNTSLHQRAKFVFEFPEYGDDWTNALDSIGTSQDPDMTWRQVANKTDTPRGSNILSPTQFSKSGSGAINYYARWVLMQNIVKLKLHKRYSRFIITRADHFYLCPHPTERDLDNSYVWLPDGQDWGGMEDRHFVCSGNDILTALNVLPPLITNPKKYLELRRGINPEGLTKLRWQEDGLLDKVKRFRRNMFLVKTANDTTRWSKANKWIREPKDHPALGLGLKY
jgi:hypothetical protein